LPEGSNPTIEKTLTKKWGRYNATVNAVAFDYLKSRLTDTDGADHIEVVTNMINVGRPRSFTI